MPDKYLIRQPIIDQLMAQLPSKVILINGPPGSGKSMLMRQFTTQLDEVICWHPITKFETDLSVFMQGFTTTLSLELPDIATITRQIDNPELLIHELITYLRSLGKRITIVLDNVQMLASHARVVTWIDTLIEVLPDNIQIILITQLIPPQLSITKLYAKDNLIALYQQQLWFTEDDVSALASLLGSQADVNEVWSKLRGWVAGTAVALRTDTHQLDQWVSATVPHEVIFNEIAGQLLNKQPPHIQRDLMKIALLEDLIPALIEDGLSIQWHRLRDYLITHNLFLIEETTDYALYNLFRRYLQQTFKLSYPQSYLESQTDIAQWYLAEGLLDSAFEHFIEAENAQEAARIAEDIAVTYYVKGRFEMLRHFHTGLLQLDYNSPPLDFIMSQVFSADGDKKQAEVLAERASAAFEEERAFTQMLKANQMVATLYMQKGCSDDAIHLMNQTLAHPHADFTVQMNGYHGLGRIYSRTGNYENALMYLERAKELADEHSGNYGKARILQDLEFVYRTLGRIEEANTALQQAIATYRELGNVNALAVALNNAGYRLYEDGNYIEALGTYQDILALPQHKIAKRTKYSLYASIGDLYRDLDNQTAALEYYNQALQLVGHSEPVIRVEILSNLSIHHRWHYQPDIAQTYSQMALEIAKPLNLYPRYEIAQIGLLAINIDPLNFDYINQTVAAIQTKLDQRPNPQLWLHLLAFQVQLNIESGNLKGVDRDLALIEQTAQQKNSIQIFISEVLHNDDLEKYLYQKHQRFPAIIAAVNKLRDNMYDTLGEVEVEISRHMAVKIFILGADVIRKGNDYIMASDWGSSDARELLWYLLFFGPRKKDALLFEFWPDVPEDSASSRFHFCVRRIRKLLGDDFVLFDPDTTTYSINPMIDVWCDALELEKLAKDVQQLSPFHPTALATLQRAAQLAQGQFLPSYESTWIYDKRSQFEQLYIRVWSQLGDCCYTLKQMNDAIHAYKFAIKLDPYYEAPYRGLMKCYHQMGEQAIMSRVYQELLSLLDVEIGILPSVKTRDLYTKLLD